MMRRFAVTVREIVTSDDDEDYFPEPGEFIISPEGLVEVLARVGDDVRLYDLTPKKLRHPDD